MTEPTPDPVPVGLAALTKARRLALMRQLAEQLAAGGVPLGDTTSPGRLAERHDPRMVYRPHTAAMDSVLTRLLGKPNARVMIFSPPQIGKSTISRWFAFWWLTMHPNHQMVLASYAASLAVTHGAAVRDLVRMYGEQYGLNLSPTENTKAAWKVRTGGGLRAIGVQGGLAGQSMDLGILDDPVKDRAEAESPVVRASVWDWYSAVWSTRRQPGTRECLVMTRYHADDLAGRLLDQDGRTEEGGEWDVLHLPALALAPDPEKGIYADPLGRAPGEPISHPKIDPADTQALIEHWATQRRRTTNRDWNALFQGVPFDAEGALLTADDLKAATRAAPGEYRRIAVGVDPSGGGRDTAGIVAAGLDADHHVWWIADKTARMSAFEWPRAACRLAHEVGADRIIYEKNYGGDMPGRLITQAWDELLREGVVSGLCPMVTEVVARKSKILRAEPIAQAVKTERAFFARVADLKQFTTEWQLWEPGSSWSPGALDAGVHVATFLLPDLPRGSQRHNPAGRRRDEARATGINARRRA